MIGHCAGMSTLLQRQNRGDCSSSTLGEETIGDGLTLGGKLVSSELGTERVPTIVSRLLLLAGAGISDSSVEEPVRDGAILFLSIASGLKG